MKDVSLQLMQELTDSINHFLSSNDPNAKLMTLHEVAMGFVAVANESMSRPIRALTQVRSARPLVSVWVWFLCRPKVTILLVTFWLVLVEQEVSMPVLLLVIWE